MILSERVLHALDALRVTANHEAITNDNIRYYPGDLSNDTIQILESDGAPFLWAAHHNGSFLVLLDRPDAQEMLDGIQSSYGRLDWYIWDGEPVSGVKMRRILPVNGKLITDARSFRQK